MHIRAVAHAHAGKEVVQAVVEDVASFKVWAKEAFELWKSDWASCYEVSPNCSPTSMFPPASFPLSLHHPLSLAGPS
eukprot:1136740-Pelagomonas_calceolata.AAC.5